MVTVKKEGIVLSKTDLEFEADGVLNPAVIRQGNFVHMFYRAVRKGNNSTIGYCKFEGPLTLVERHKAPLLLPLADYESRGVEDPRITRIDDLYYLSYTAYDGINALGALALSEDMIKFERYGLIVPQIATDEFKRLAGVTNLVSKKYFRAVRHFKPERKIFLWDKNVIFFPRRVEGNLFFLHRIRPGIQVVSVSKLSDLTKEFWDNYFLHFKDNIVIEPKYAHEASYVGGGCPPIETTSGWVVIYHGVYDAMDGYVYSACAALLDLRDPRVELARLPYPLFSPAYNWEMYGVVDNVVFPTGTALFDDTLYIYYGAADKRIACASLSLSELVGELLANLKENRKEMAL